MAVLDKNGTEYLWNKAKEKFAAKDDVSETPEGVVLYTEQSLTDDQKTQARGNIGAVGTVEATEEVYTYVFTGEEEQVPFDALGVPFRYIEGVAEEFVRGLERASGPKVEEWGIEITFGANGIYQIVEETNDIATIFQDTDGSVFFAIVTKVDDASVAGLTFPKKGAYYASIVDIELGDLSVVSLTSTVPYTKKTQKIDEALISAHAHSWEELEDKPFEEIVTYEEVMPEQEITGEDWGGQYGLYLQDISAFTYDIAEYFVTFDGTEYKCNVTIDGEDIYFGNMALMTGGLDTGEPFGVGILVSSNLGGVGLKDTGVHVIKIVGIKNIVEKMDEKFIPAEWLAYKTKTVTEISTQEALEQIDTGVSGSYGYLESNGALAQAMNSGAYESFELDVNGTTVTGLRVVSIQGLDKMRFLGNLSFVVSGYPDNGLPIGIRSEVGEDNALVVSTSSIDTLAVRGTQMVPEKLPEEYLPESVSDVTIRSSTSGSTKKFKLTVDDSGTISATEVV